MFMAELRFKEVGIRKVLGATEGSLLILLTEIFLRLVLISFLLSIPISWVGHGQMAWVSFPIVRK